jgi:putative FmdB family regulatory protein
MPIYEYECSECHCRFDKKQRFHDEAAAACPKCKGRAKRMLSPVASIFRGPGFYLTDCRKDIDNAKRMQDKMGK